MPSIRNKNLCDNFTKSFASVLEKATDYLWCGGPWQVANKTVPHLYSPFSVPISSRTRVPLSRWNLPGWASWVHSINEYRFFGYSLTPQLTWDLVYFLSALWTWLLSFFPSIRLLLNWKPSFCPAFPALSGSLGHKTAVGPSPPPHVSPVIETILNK